MGVKAAGAARRPRSAGAGGVGARARGGQPGSRPSGRPARASEGVPAAASPFGPRVDVNASVRATVEGLRYDLVDIERAPRGLLRVTIDRRPGEAYAAPGEAITVDDCEVVTRQLRYALEVDGVDYARLEVSSPGLDRPLRTEADYARFAGLAISLALREPFQGRKHYQGRLERGPTGWQITFEDGKATQVLSFTLDEVREARLVPVVDFKGRAGRAGGAEPAPGAVKPATNPGGASDPAAPDEVPGGQAAEARENEEGRNR